MPPTRQWTVTGEFRDEGISGSKDRRPALDRLMAEAAAARGRHLRLEPRPLRPQPGARGDDRPGAVWGAAVA